MFFCISWLLKVIHLRSISSNSLVILLRPLACSSTELQHAGCFLFSRVFSVNIRDGSAGKSVQHIWPLYVLALLVLMLGLNLYRLTIEWNAFCVCTAAVMRGQNHSCLYCLHFPFRKNWWCDNGSSKHCNNMRSGGGIYRASAAAGNFRTPTNNLPQIKFDQVQRFSKDILFQQEPRCTQAGAWGK